MNIMFNGSLIDEFFFRTIKVTDVEGVEVLRTTGKIDLLTGVSNVIIITSKRGKSIVTKEEVPSVITYRSNGLYKAREFYSPKYNNVNANLQSPDLRTAIYWKPDIVTDKDGNATLSFFNADTKGTYRVVIEGVDVSGNLGRQVYTYKVE